MANYHKSPTFTRSIFLIVFILITFISLSYILFGHSTRNLSRLFSYAPKPTDTPSLGTSFQTFFHDALNPSDPDYQSLLSQARQVIAIDGSNGFLRMREEGEEEAVSYGVSMFHQLHCVEMLRAVLRGKGHQHGVKGRRGLQAPPHQLEEGEMSAEEHLEHCLDYITQVNIDMFLEVGKKLTMERALCVQLMTRLSRLLLES
jgi:hypothetical protein